MSGEVELPNRKTNDDSSSDSSNDDSDAELPKTTRPVTGGGGEGASDGENKTGNDDNNRDSDDSGNSGNSDDSEDDGSDQEAGAKGREKKKKKKAKKKKERMASERQAGEDRRQLRRAQNGPYSRDAPNRLFKLSSLFSTVFVFITAVVCFQWNCLFARMCFVVEDPAVPQPQSYWVLPIIVVALITTPIAHLLTMSESQNGLTIFGLILFGWAIFVLVVSIISFTAAAPDASATAATEAWASSPFESGVIRKYYADEEALRLKLVSNLQALGGCGLAISLLQMWQGLNGILFGCKLLRSY